MLRIMRPLVIDFERLLNYNDFVAGVYMLMLMRQTPKLIALCLAVRLGARAYGKTVSEELLRVMPGGCASAVFSAEYRQVFFCADGLASFSLRPLMSRHIRAGQ